MKGIMLFMYSTSGSTANVKYGVNWKYRWLLHLHRVH